jgi:hypothetical protein
MKPLKSYQEATQCLSDYVLLDPKCPPYRSWGCQIPRSEILLLKRGLIFGKNAKIFLKGEVFGFWALFKNYSPGLETFETHFNSFELLYCIYKSPSPQAKVLVPQSLFREYLVAYAWEQVPQSSFKQVPQSSFKDPVASPPVLTDRLCMKARGQKGTVWGVFVWILDMYSNVRLHEFDPVFSCFSIKQWYQCVGVSTPC